MRKITSLMTLLLLFAVCGVKAQSVTFTPGTLQNTTPVASPADLKDGGYYLIYGSRMKRIIKQENPNSNNVSSVALNINATGLENALCLFRLEKEETTDGSYKFAIKSADGRYLQSSNSPKVDDTRQVFTITDNDGANIDGVEIQALLIQNPNGSYFADSWNYMSAWGNPADKSCKYQLFEVEPDIAEVLTYVNTTINFSDDKGNSKTIQQVYENNTTVTLPSSDFMTPSVTQITPSVENYTFNISYVNTLPFTLSKVENGQLVNPTWYKLTLRGSKYVGYRPYNLSNGNYQLTTDATQTNSSAYLWTISGDPFENSFEMHNIVYGAAKSINTNQKLDNSGTKWDALKNDTGFILRQKGTAYNCINDVSGTLGYWNSTWATTDAGSTFRVAAIATTEEIAAAEATFMQDMSTALTNMKGENSYIDGKRVGTYAEDPTQKFNEAETALASATTAAEADAPLLALRQYLNNNFVNIVAGKYYRFENKARPVEGAQLYARTDGGNTYFSTAAGKSDVETLIQVVADGGNLKFYNPNYKVYMQLPANSSEAVVPANAISEASKAEIATVGGGECRVKLAGHFTTINNAANLVYYDIDEPASRWRISTVEDVTVAIDDLGYVTRNYPFSVDLTAAREAGLQVYTVKAESATAALLEEFSGNVLAKEQPVLFYSATTGSFSLPISGEEGEIPAVNSLSGTLAPKAVTENAYILSGNSADTFGFYQLNPESNVVAANRAYLVSTSNAPVLKLNPGDATGIENVENAKSDSTWYTIDGRRVAQPAKGIYVNSRGQKVLFK